MPAVVLAILVATYYISRYVREEMYFRGEEFLAHKGNIAAFVAEHNDMSDLLDLLVAEDRLQMGQ